MINNDCKNHDTYENNDDFLFTYVVTCISMLNEGKNTQKNLTIAVSSKQ